MPSSPAITERKIKIASALRPLGHGPLTREQALLAAQLLDVHWSHVYRLRRRFLASPVTSSWAIHKTGRRAGHRVDPSVEAIVQIALHQWMPQQIHLVHPLLDLCNEVGKRCTDADLPHPSRNTVAERWALYRDEQQAVRALFLGHGTNLAAGSTCPVRGLNFRALSSGRVIACKTLDQLIQLVSQEERKSRNHGLRKHLAQARRRDIAGGCTLHGAAIDHADHDPVVA